MTRPPSEPEHNGAMTSDVTANPPYELVEGWEQLPDGYAHLDVADVAVDAADRVHLVTRMDPRVIVYLGSRLERDFHGQAGKGHPTAAVTTPRKIRQPVAASTRGSTSSGTSPPTGSRSG